MQHRSIARSVLLSNHGNKIELTMLLDLRIIIIK